MSGIQRSLRKALRWGLFFVLQTALFWSAQRLHWMAGGVSLRFAAPFSVGQAEKALEYAQGAASGYAFTLWTERPNVPAAANGRAANARLLAVCGDAVRLVPQRMLWGAPPVAPGGCAVSDALAWRLWGALDVADMELTAGEARYVVRGVFRDDALCLIAQTAPDGAAYENAEVYAMEDGAPGLSAAAAFARRSGLGAAAHTVNGGALAALTRLLCRLPAALCAVALLLRLARALPARARRVFWAAGLLLAVLWLPKMLPAAWLPTRWSDFAFWQALLQAGAARINAWFSLPPQSVDVAAKWLLLRHGALCLGGCAAGLRAASLSPPAARFARAPAGGILWARCENTI